MRDGAARKQRQVIVGVGYRLGPAPGRAEEQLVRGADGDQRAVGIVRGPAASPGVVCFYVRQDLEAPARMLLHPLSRHAIDVGRGRIGVPTPRWEKAELVVMIVKRQTHLLEIILTADAVGGLADLLHGRQQQAHEHPNDRNDD